MLKVVVTGAAGRMGGTVIRLLGREGLALAGATEKPGFSAGLDAGTAAGIAALGVPVRSSLAEALASRPDAVVDFTYFEASAAHAEACAAAGVPIVIGSTGFTAEARARVAAAARAVPVVLSPNMSAGVNVMFDLVRRAATVLGEGFDVEIAELHHRMKADAPSGTALRLAEVAAEALQRDPVAVVRTARSGMIGARPPREIGIQALRGGDVVGEHTVFLCGAGERLEITHRATSREQFALGALRAVRWIAGKPAGLYDMGDVLGLR